METPFLAKDKNLIHTQLADLLIRHEEILFAYLFGSSVHDPGFHDLDIGVYLAEDVLKAFSKKAVFDYELSLGTALEKQLPYPVDVKVLNCAPVPLCYAVTQGKVLFSRHEATRYAWIEKTWDLYLDMKYFFRSSLFDLLTPGKH